MACKLLQVVECGSVMIANLRECRHAQRRMRSSLSEHLHVQYAAARIEELEQQLAVIWGDDGPHESGAECISCERPAMQDTWPYCRICLLAGQLEVCDEGFGDAVKRIEELEQQLREGAARAQSEAVAWPHFPPCNCSGCKLVRGIRQATVGGGAE